MKKIILLLFLFCFMFGEKVDATFFYYDDEKVEDMFITRSDGVTTKSGNPYILKRRDNDKFVYCLEPLAMLNQESDYLEFNYNDPALGLTNESVDKINLIAYYGYLYPGHEDIKWYGITQYLIWKELYPYLDISFTDSRFGNKIEAYTEEVNELNYLVNRDIIEDYDGLNYDIKVGQSYIIMESDILYNYEVDNNSPMDVYIEGNMLFVSSDYEGNYSVTLKRKNRKENNYFLYYNPNGQNLFFSGKVDDDMTLYFNCELINLTINKHDFDSQSNDYITLDGARYGVFDLDNNLIVDGLTVDGKINFKLPRGRYIIMEIEPSYGYSIDMYTYEVDLADDYEFDVYERKILKKVVIHKVYEENKQLIDEPDITFYLYKDKDIIGKYKTDLNGFISFNLPYGEYSLIQINSKEGYSFADNIALKIDENFNEEEILIVNKKEKTEELPLDDEPEVENPIEEVKESTEEINVEEKDVLGASYSEDDYVVPNTSKNVHYNLLLIIFFISIGIYAFVKIIC